MSSELEDLRREFGGLKQESLEVRKKAESLAEEAMLFFSYDIVGSTRLKEERPDEWYQIINEIYAVIYAEVKSNREIQLWKYIGDEVVFYVQVTSLQSIDEYVRYIYRALLRLCSKKIGAGSSAVPVSLKATAWIAAVANKVDKKKNTENYFLLTREGQDQFNEFLGPEIDKGFRIAKAAEKGQFVLSYELAFLFFEAVEAKSGMGVLKTGPCIVSYKQFKGVWNDGEYPVIKYKAGSEDRIQNSRDGLRALLDENRNREKIEHIKTVIENPGDVFLRTKNPHVEFHCTAICYKEGKIMIAKRKGRSHDNGCWDFGGGPITASYDIKKNLKDRYLCDFGLDIEPKTVWLGNEAEPVPVTLFEMQLESGKYLFGSTILSEIKGGKTAVNKGRFSEIDYVDENNYKEKLNEENSVNGVIQTLEIVFKNKLISPQR